MQLGNFRSVLGLPLIPVADNDAIMENNVIDYEQYLASLPKAYCFIPTEEELAYYLKEKVTGGFIPSTLIHEVDIYKLSPDELKARYKREGQDNMFFFSHRKRKYANGKRPDRTVAGIGYWRTSRTNQLKCGTRVVGSKMILNFHMGTSKNNTKTHWIMEEFILKENSTITPQNRATSSADPLDKKLDDWFLYKIHYHKTKADKKECQNSQKVEISKPVLQIPALESQSEQNQPSMVMPIDTFIPATATSTTTPAHSTQYSGNWKMHEFILDNQLDDWVLNQIYGQTKDDKPECKGIEEVEIPKPVLQNATPELETQQSEPSMVMANDTFIPAMLANSTHCLGYCEPITPFFDNGDYSAALLPELSMGDWTYYMPSLLGDDNGFMLPQEIPKQMPQNPALKSQSQQNQPSMVMSIDRFIPATTTATPSHSTPYLSNCEPITPFFGNGDDLAALLQEPSVGDWTYFMPSMIGDDNGFILP